jgi:ABC-type methionine transport system permease subunit
MSSPSTPAAASDSVIPLSLLADDVELKGINAIWREMLLFTVLMTTVSYTVAGAFGLESALLTTMTANGRRAAAVAQTHSSNRAGCMACRVVRGFSFLWLPIVMGVVGAIIGFFFGAVPAVFISTIYASVPMTVQLYVVRVMGAAQGVIATYLSLGRSRTGLS